MKQYFTKYLPVEGEKKEKEGIFPSEDDFVIGGTNPPIKKKLFLCSRDNNEPVGEVSEDAKWIKEGMEFDEDEIELWGHTITPNTRQAIRAVGFDNYKKYMEKFQKLIIKIKGPCGHFH